jgi:hypothetical protein
MSTQAQAVRGQGPRAGGQCAKDRATARGKKFNLVIAVARASEGQQIPRPSLMVPSWHKKKLWAYLLTVKRDTEKNCNQISWKLWALLLTVKQDTVKTSHTFPFTLSL